jgi:hypothetical protein
LGTMVKERTLTWDRNLWGVEFRGRFKEDPPTLIGQAWHKAEGKNLYIWEPTRALVFCTREQAREWCKKKNEGSAHLGWRFIPVKVRELVEKVPNEHSSPAGDSEGGKH